MTILYMLRTIVLLETSRKPVQYIEKLLKIKTKLILILLLFFFF